jgi:hypothetical protein
MSERSGVEIDYCPECRGVWLDRGELDKIIDKSMVIAPKYENRGDQSYKYSNNDKYSSSDPHYKQKRKESFLGDLFDF